MSPHPVHAARVWWRHWLVFRRLLLAEVGPMFAEPVAVLLAMGLGLGGAVRLADVPSYGAFIAPGILAGYAFFAAAFECTYNSYLRMEIRHVWKGMTATPVNLADVVAGDICWGATRAVLSATAVLVVVACVGYVGSPWALLVPLVAAWIGLAAASLSMVCCAVSPSMVGFNYYITLFLMPMFYLGGTFFPVDQLPAGLREATWVLPLTSGVHVMRRLVEGRPDGTCLLALGWLGLVAVGSFVLAQALMRRRLVR